MVEGMIEFILESLESESLKKILSFHFFPNMNPDGTKYGNNRYNLTGTDLEKVWKTPSKERSSEVYYLKQYLV